MTSYVLTPFRAFIRALRHLLSLRRGHHIFEFHDEVQRQSDAFKGC